MTTTDVPWGSLEKAERPGSHISEAGVALDGSLIAKGSIQHILDDNGYFLPHAGDVLRISRLRGMRIVRCRSSRDASGFLEVAEYGAEVHVPPPFAVIIQRALHLGLKEPIVAQLGYQIGQLVDSVSTIKTLVQPLTDWTLDIEEEAGTIHVRLSAALNATQLESWNTSHSNYWSSYPSNRIDVVFAITASTRVACYGAYVPVLDQGPNSVAIIPAISDSPALNICNAPVGTFTQFAISGSRWLHFYENSEMKSFSITEHDAPERTALGFLADSHRYRWPRITIDGIDLDGIAAAIAPTGSLRITLQNGRFGRLSYGGPEGRSIDIIGVDLTAKLSNVGLKFSYEVKTNNDVKSGEFYLMRELLILRYPKLASIRS